MASSKPFLLEAFVRWLKHAHYTPQVRWLAQDGLPQESLVITLLWADEGSLGFLNQMGQHEVIPLDRCQCLQAVEIPLVLPLAFHEVEQGRVHVPVLSHILWGTPASPSEKEHGASSIDPDPEVLGIDPSVRKGLHLVWNADTSPQKRKQERTREPDLGSGGREV